MTPSECDFYRAQKLEQSRALAGIVLYTPLTFDFAGAKSSTGDLRNAKGELLEDVFSRLQRRFSEWRSAFQTVKNRHAIDRLARDLLRVSSILARNATGWVDFRGNVHPFACDHPEVDELAPEPTEAEQRAMDSL